MDRRPLSPGIGRTGTGADIGPAPDPPRIGSSECRALEHAPLEHGLAGDAGADPDADLAEASGLDVESAAEPQQLAAGLVQG